MVKVMEDDVQMLAWVREFLPQLFDPEFELIPAEVIDRTDGKLVHLDGLNFSRAWCLYNLARRLAKMDSEDNLLDTADRLILTADKHIRYQIIEMKDTKLMFSRKSMDNVVGSDYAGSHWLASFLMYALQTRSEVLLVRSQ